MGRVVRQVWIGLVLVCALVPFAHAETPLYAGGPVPHPAADAFYTYMSLMGRHRFAEAYRYRAGISRQAFLRQAQREWAHYTTLFAQAGLTFRGWRVRAVDYTEDVRGNLYIRLVQSFRLQRGDRLLLRHAGFLVRVTFQRTRIVTIDIIRGQILGEEWQTATKDGS